MLPQAPWDDRTKFIADTVKTIVIGTLGALAVLLAVKPWEVSLAYTAEVDKARLAVSARVVDDFLTTAYLYTNAAFDACNGDVQAAEKYQGELFDQFRAAENRLSIYFAAHQQVQTRVKTVQEVTGALFQLCKTGASKDTWELRRRELKSANNLLAQEALKALGF